MAGVLLLISVCIGDLICMCIYMDVCMYLLYLYLFLYLYIPGFWLSSSGVRVLRACLLSSHMSAQ